MAAASPRLRRVRVRLLPWRPRWRVRRVDAPDVSMFLDGADDPVSLVIALLLAIVLAPALVLLAVGLLVLSIEVLALLPLAPLLFAGRLVRLQPWRLVLTFDDGSRVVEEISGTRQLWRRRAELRARRGQPLDGDQAEALSSSRDVLRHGD